MIKVYKSQKAAENIIKTYDQLLNKWGVPFEERDIETSYGSTHVITAGNKEGKPLILFHGVGDDSALMWLYNAKEWAKDFRLFAIDTLGGPGKSRPNENYNKNFDDAKWIDEIREKLGLEKVSLIGVSNGGYLVQYYNLMRSKWIDKAISMASSVPDEQSESTMKTMLKVFFPEAFFPNDKNVKKLLEKMAGEKATVFTGNPDILEHYKWLLKGFNNMAMRYHNVRKFTNEEIRKIKDNTYYIIGEEDPFEKLGGKNALLRHDMNARFFTGTGHGINHEEARAVNKLVIEILKGEVQNIRTYK